VTERLVASTPDDPALEALAAGLGPARALGLDVETAEAVLRDARAAGNGAASGNGSTPKATPVASAGRAGHAAAAREALAVLAQAAGLKAHGVRDLIPDPAQRRGIDGAIAEVALVLDMDTFEDQALAVVRNRARAQGLGPIKLLVALRDRRSPRPTDPADPAAHLLAWKARGVLTRAGDRVRAAIGESLAEMPARLRPLYTAAGESDLEQRIERGIDALVEEFAPAASAPPEQRRWRFVGWLQWLNVALFVIAIVSLIGSITGALPVWTIHLPFFRGVPAAPFMIVLGPLLAFALTLGLNLHADRLGRAWSSRIENDIRRGVRVVVEAEAFAPLAPVESARARLGEAWHRILAG
jgi:hypothetical protein